MESKELMTKFLEMRRITMKLLDELGGEIMDDGEGDGKEWKLVVGGKVLYSSYSMFYIWKKVAELHKQQFGEK